MPEAKKTSSFLWRPVKWLASLVGLFLLYIAGSITYASLTDYDPADRILLTQDGKASLAQISDSTLSLISWNVGYGGLGAESDFFYHGRGFWVAGEQMVRPPKEAVEKNLNGVLQLLKEQQADFYLLQEVDENSKRSYFIDQYADYQNQLPDYESTLAINYEVKRVMVPLFEPWRAYGKTDSGLGTFSRYQANEAIRYQLPGNFGWPKKVFMLDRCLAVQRYLTSWGKDLLVINLHNSAFDRSGTLKNQELDFLKNLILEEYEKGNYVIVGGDWNQCPPNFRFDTFRPGARPFDKNFNIDPFFLPPTWQWIYDPQVPTNRSTTEVYEPGKTWATIIDYFLVSPNVRATAIKCIDQDFAFSDHQAVRIEVVLE